MATEPSKDSNCYFLFKLWAVWWHQNNLLPDNSWDGILWEGWEISSVNFSTSVSFPVANCLVRRLSRYHDNNFKSDLRIIPNKATDRLLSSARIRTHSSLRFNFSLHSMNCLRGRNVRDLCSERKSSNTKIKNMVLKEYDSNHWNYGCFYEAAGYRRMT